MCLANSKVCRNSLMITGWHAVQIGQLEWYACRLPVPSPASSARHATRLLTACIGVVMFAVLVAAKYTTDASIRASLYTYRSYSLKEAQDMLGAFDYGNEAASPPNVVCPCSQYQTSLSEFMTYSFVNPSKAYSQDLPLCQIDRSYGPLSDAPQNDPGHSGVDFGCATYFQAGATGDEDYSYGWFCNSFYISMTCQATVAALRSDPSVSATVSSNQLLNPRELNESVALAVHGEHPPLHTGNCICICQHGSKTCCSHVHAFKAYNYCIICMYNHCIRIVHVHLLYYMCAHALYSVCMHLTACSHSQ